MTKRRKLVVASLVSALFGLGIGVVVLLPEEASVTKTNFDRIEKGMSQADVEAIFGSGPWCPMMWLGCCGIHVEVWKNQDGSEANITFNLDSVDSKSWTASSESIVGKLRRWLHFPCEAPSSPVGTTTYQTISGISAIGLIR